jgi:high-affinity iron transporter
MLQSFVIVLREGFEAFLIVSIIFAYLKKVGQVSLLPAVWWGTGVSLAASTGMGFVLARGVNEPLWEGILGVVAAVMVTSLTLHMWKHARTMKKEMESTLEKKLSLSSASGMAMFWGVFLFTVFMITREGMETALMLIQVPERRIFFGVLFGLLAVSAFCVLWVRFSQFINVKLFFQVTGIFLLLFVAQILIYSFHEFSEAGLLPNSEAFHLATEPFSPDGLYGKWFSVVSIGISAAWLVVGWAANKRSRKGPEGRNA